MTDSDPQLIRHATIDDLDALAAMESECFPAAEAADRSSLRVFMATLRKKIEPGPTHPLYIQTHVGVGYRMMRVD